MRIYLCIPLELVGFLVNIEVKIKNKLVLIGANLLEENYKLKEKGSVNLYKIDFDIENSYINLIEKKIFLILLLLNFILIWILGIKI